MTQTQLQAAITRNQARVIDLLKWNMASYSDFMYNSGLKYLEAYTGKDHEAARLLAPRPEFWNWWKILFNARDEAFINEFDGMEDHITSATMVATYQKIHSPGMLACEIHPPKVVYGNNFVNVKMSCNG